MARGNVRVSITADASGVARETRTAERHIDRFSKSAGKGMKNLGGATGVLSSRMGKLAAAASAVGVGYIAIAEGKEAISVTTDLAKATIGLHKNLGLTVERASEWAAVAKTRDVETKALNMSFGTLAKQQLAAKAGTDASTDAFKRLGVTQKELKTLNFNELLFDVSDGLGKMKGSGDKTALSMKLFGRGWQTIVPILREGSKGMQEQLALARQYGATFSGGTVKSMADFIQAQREAKFATLGLQIAFSTQLAPVLTEITLKMARFFKSKDGKAFLKGMADGIREVVVSFVHFGKWTANAIRNVSEFGAKGRRAFFSVVDAAKGAFNDLKRVFGNVMAGIFRGFAKLFDVAAKLPGIGKKFQGMADGARRAAANMDKMGEKVKEAGDATERLRPLKEMLDSIAAVGFDNLDPLKDEGPLTRLRNIPRNRNRRGGMNMGPALLSPGEMGITPDGGTFTVPGARVAADNVPALLPPGTAILTDSGQAMLGMGASLDQAIARQAPHFKKGGVSGIDTATIAARSAGKLKGRDLVNMVAIAGRESGYNPKAHNYDPPRDDSWGLWQINVLPNANPQYAGLARSGKLADPMVNAKIMGEMFRGSGYSPWVGVNYGNAASFVDDAQAAVLRTKGKETPGGGRDTSFTRTTPSPISHPLLGNVLAPLQEDALLGGITAGMEGTSRRGLLTSTLEGILPQSGDRATRERVTIAGRSGRGGGATAPGDAPQALKFMLARANAIDAKGYPYSSPGNRSFGIGGPMDCSGAVSKVVGPNVLGTSVQASPFYLGWGEAGEGKYLTTHSRGGFGASGHVFMTINGRDWGTSGENPGGGAGWFTADPSYKAGFTHRHPKGFRRGGVVGEGRLAELVQRLPKKWQTPQVIAEIRRHGIMPGMRRGGIVGMAAGGLMSTTGDAGAPLIRARRQRKHINRRIKKIFEGGVTKAELPTARLLQRVLVELNALIEQLEGELYPPARRGGIVGMQGGGWFNQIGGGGGPTGEDRSFLPRGGIGAAAPGARARREAAQKNAAALKIRRLMAQIGRDGIGSEGANRAIRQLSALMPGASMRQLVVAQRNAKKQIRAMAKSGPGKAPHLTGPERIRTRRLQGALSLLQDQMGRPMGRAIGASDRAQERISRGESNLQNRLIVSGIDPNAVAGLEAQRSFAEESIGTLGRRRAALVKAMARAKKTKTKADDRAVQAEMNEVDDQILGLRASIVGLNQSIEQIGIDALIEAQNRANELAEQRIALEKEKKDRDLQFAALVQGQGPALIAALTQIWNGGIGGNVGLGRQTPSFAGIGGLARL